MGSQQQTHSTPLHLNTEINPHDDSTVIYSLTQIVGVPASMLKKSTHYLGNTVKYTWRTGAWVQNAAQERDAEGFCERWVS